MIHAKFLLLYEESKLGKKFAVSVLGVSLLISLVITATQSFIIYTQGVKEAKSLIDEIERSYVPSLSQSLWSIDETQIGLLLDGIIELNNVGEVILMDEKGAKMTRTQSSPFSPIATKEFNLRYEIGQTVYDLGVLKIQLSPDYILSRLWDNVKFIALTTFFTLFIIAYYLVFLFRNRVSIHLQKMADFATNIDLNELDEQLVLDRDYDVDDDELEEVVIAFNKMRLKIKEELISREKSERELEKYKRELEHRVEERTKEVLQKSQLLEEQNKELDAYAHTVAHDLKQPVNSLIGITSLLNEDLKDLDYHLLKEYAGLIDKSAWKMNRIINSLLLLSNVRKSAVIQKESVDIGKTAQNAIDRLGELSETKDANITLQANKKWPVLSSVNQWIEEVWVNYLSNAIKYAGNAPNIEIDFSTDANTGQLKFWVLDDGPGIKEGLQEHLFQEFNRLHNTSSEGHGLGLSIVQRIVSRLGGQVGYENVENKGSKFWFTLPFE